MNGTSDLSEQYAAALEAKPLPAGHTKEQPLKPRRCAYGLLARYGPGPTEQEIDENRREMFSG